MEIIEGVSLESCTNSRYIQPYRVLYKQNGEQKYWDCIKMHDSVATLIYNKTRKSFVLVRQFRPAVYMSQHRQLWEQSLVFTNSLSEKGQVVPSATASTPPVQQQKLEETDAGTREYGHGSLGCTYELCAGIVDKKSSLQKIAQEEIHEETGYNVPLDSLEWITAHYSSIGTGGSQQNMFYCEVTDSQLETDGGGNSHEGECIEVVYLPVDEADAFLTDPKTPKSSGLSFAFLWFDKYKKPHLQS